MSRNDLNEINFPFQGGRKTMNIDTVSCLNIDNTELRRYQFDLRKDLCFVSAI